MWEVGRGQLVASGKWEKRKEKKFVRINVSGETFWLGHAKRNVYCAWEVWERRGSCCLNPKSDIWAFKMNGYWVADGLTFKVHKWVYS